MCICSMKTLITQVRRGLYDDNETVLLLLIGTVSLSFRFKARDMDEDTRVAMH